MLNAFGIFGGAVGLALSVWFIHVGFLIKKSLKEQQETNRLLRDMGAAGAGLGTVSKAA
ncbi:MAG: hypothetical protein ACLQVL_10245 [Terriglobia bacterium]